MNPLDRFLLDGIEPDPEIVRCFTETDEEAAAIVQAAHDRGVELRTQKLREWQKRMLDSRGDEA